MAILELPLRGGETREEIGRSFLDDCCCCCCCCCCRKRRSSMVGKRLVHAGLAPRGWEFKSLPS